MKAANHLYFVIIFFSILGCKNDGFDSVDIRDHENFDIVHLDPQKSISLKTSDFVDSVQFVPLETTKESELSEIAQIECLGDRYIILDKNTSQILFFNKKGKFLKKISPDSDELPTPYKKIVYFTIDRHHEKIYFNDLQSTKIFEFSLEGDYLDVYQKKEIDYHIRENHHVNECQLSYFAYRGFPKDEGTSHNMVVFEDGAIRHTYLPFDASIINREDVYGAGHYFFESDNLVFFTKPYSENVYCFDSSGEMFRAFQFKFPKQLSIPEDFTTNQKYGKKRKRFIKDNGTKIYLITDFFKIDRNLIFRLLGGRYSDLFFYDLSNKSIVSLTKYISDSTTHFLPILGNNIVGIDNDKLLSSFSSKQFIDLVNNRSKQGGDINTLPKGIKEIYDQGNDQNPMLLLTTLKKKISFEDGF